LKAEDKTGLFKLVVVYSPLCALPSKFFVFDEDICGNW